MKNRRSDQRLDTVNDSSIQYIFVAQLMIGLMLGVSLLIAWRTIDRRAHALIWSVAFFVSTANGVLNALNFLFPSREIYWLVVNAMSLTMASLAYVGFRKRAGLRPGLRWLLPTAIAVELAIAWYTVGDHHMGLRMFLSPIYSAAMLLAGAIVVLRSGDMRAAERTTAAVLLGFSVAQIASGIVALMQGPDMDERYLGLYQKLTFLTQPAFHAALGISVVLLLADDLSKRMRRLAITDGLTGLLNRRGFEELGGGEVARVHRHGGSLAVALLDIDHFKSINDEHGHGVGDRALELIAAAMRKTTRQTDLVARIGGEEFVVLMPATSAQGAEELSDRLRLSIGSCVVKGRHLTASIGVAVLEPGERLWDFVSRADRALYGAKELGRDRVVAAEPGAFETLSGLRRARA